MYAVGCYALFSRVRGAVTWQIALTKTNAALAAFSLLRPVFASQYVAVEMNIPIEAVTDSVVTQYI